MAPADFPALLALGRFSASLGLPQPQPFPPGNLLSPRPQASTWAEHSQPGHLGTTPMSHKHAKAPRAWQYTGCACTAFNCNHISSELPFPALSWAFIFNKCSSCQTPPRHLILKNPTRNTRQRGRMQLYFPETLGSALGFSLFSH